MASATSIKTPQILRLAVKGSAERPSVDFRVILDETKGAYVNAGITVEHVAVPVTPTLLARMRLGQLRRDALRATLAEQNAELTSIPALKTYLKGSNGRAVAEKVRLNPTAEHLELVGTIHRLARLIGDYPSQAVGRTFGLERDDAQRWLAHARKASHI